MFDKHFHLIIVGLLSLAFGAFTISIFAEASHRVMVAQQEGY